MEKSEIKGFIAKRCAKELKDGDVVNLGIGLPTLIPNYLPEGVEVIIHAELGIVSAGVSPKEGDANYDPYHVWMPAAPPPPWLTAAASLILPPTSADPRRPRGRLLPGALWKSTRGQPGQLDHPRQEDARHGRRDGPVRGRQALHRLHGAHR